MKTVETKDGDWRKPVVVDDWGVVGYYLRAVMSDTGTWSISQQDPTQRLAPGDRLLVRWPDGSETREVVVGRPYTETVSDMGQPNDVSGTRLVVEAAVRCAKVDVPLESLWVRR